MPSAECGQMLVLINEDALGLPPDALDLPDAAQVMVAGRSLVQMTLAELALPGAQMIWTDFRQSASLSALHATLQRAGGLDRLILATDGDKSEAVFSIMCAVLTFLPALRRRPQARVLLMLEGGQAVGSLVEFIRRIEPRIARDGIQVEVQIRDRRRLRTVA